MSDNTKSPVSPWSDRLELGEGARWRDDGRLVLVDIFAGRLLTDDGTARLRTLAQLPVPLGAVAPIHGASDMWIAAAGTGVCVLTHYGDVTWIGHIEQGPTDAMRVNDAVADASGRLWFGTMDADGADEAGSLYRVERDGTITRVLGQITCPNGPAFTEDGTVMYLADSSLSLVRRYDVDPATGAVGAPTPFADFAGSGAPDGMTVDREGGVWITHWGGRAVHRYLPDGTLDHTIEVPAEQPTSVCLGGDDGRLLYITSATYEMNKPDPFDGAIFTVRVDVPGFAAASFRPEGRVAAIVEQYR